MTAAHVAPLDKVLLRRLNDKRKSFSISTNRCRESGSKLNVEDSKVKNHGKALFAAGIAASLLLTSCSGTDDSISADGATIELWTSWTEGQGTANAGLEQLKKFEEATGYKVNQTNLTYDMLHDKIVASAAGGNLPDIIFGLPEYIGEFNQMGILADLTESWDSWSEKDNVSDAVKAAVSYGDKVVGFPYEATVRAYQVHDSIFEEAGVEVPATWEDVLAIGTTVKDKTGAEAWGVAAAGVRSPQELLVYLEQAGAQIATVQADGKYKNVWAEDATQMAGAVKTFEFYQDMFASGVASENARTYGWEETDENFANALTASYVTGNWLGERGEEYADTMSDVSIHPIPAPEGGKAATYLETKPLMVLENGKDRGPAIELAQTISGFDWQNAAYQEKSALTNVSSDTIWSKDFSKLLETGITFPPVTLSGITQNMIDSLGKLLLDNQTPEEVALWLSESVNKSLSENGELSE